MKIKEINYYSCFEFQKFLDFFFIMIKIINIQIIHNNSIIIIIKIKLIIL